ncbi:Uncharacterized protein BP5553_09618 [Venustampulla echinocandica]|uniref:Ring-like domain-containing protein n=1 Tax=Venustampulla echinocandica TaxID=2656787 RepID=A0A370TBJ3_9HELO|nr:Uncharacterized protein BP5553_09618 [Venustampulla echinocandica]RDL31409.1 Uncharacterized protein BP5553_09618 [Venustampulla echinocandica]
MLEYFTYKKFKKHQAQKKAADLKAQNQAPPPLLDDEDQAFLERVVSAEGTPPPLPERPRGLGVEAGDTRDNGSQMVVHDHDDAPSTAEKGRTHIDKGKGKEADKAAEKKKSNRFSFLQRSGTKKNKPDLKPAHVVPNSEAHREEDDLSTILEDLNLSAQNNRAFSLSAESQELVGKFTVILKDLINGVPTAYDDLIHLLDNSQGTLSKNYDKLPSFLKKLITQLPDKVTKNLAPELLAVAAEAQALDLGATAAGAGAGLAGAAKSFFTPSTLKDLVTKPGAVAGLLKTIMNALKYRWPAFMGTNVLLSLGLFVLLFFFWYCHKRGREVRLEREGHVNSDGRIVDVGDENALGSSPASHHHERGDERPHSSSRHHTHPSSSSRPSSSRHSGSHLKTDGRDRDRDDGRRRSRSSRKSAERSERER